MEIILNSKSSSIVFDLIKCIQNNKEYLSQVDGAIGDGDHGVNMNKGFTLCEERLKGREVSLSQALDELGTILLTEIGGSMGPLYGTLFLEMAKACQETEEINKIVFGDMLNSALRGLMVFDKAKVGDKTLLDTLYPAVDEYNKCIVKDDGFVESLSEMSEAAEKGKESTRDLVAKIGRASRLGERSRGILDAGATSCYLILDSISKSIISMLEGGIKK